MKIDYDTHTVKKFNEDIYGVIKNGAFVIDGASGLTNKNYTPSGNDVNWMVNWWKEYLEENLDDTTYSVQEILREGIGRFNKVYGEFVDLSTLKLHEQLSAGIAIVRRTGEFLEAYVLGDVEITLEDKDSEIMMITDSSIKKLDDEVIHLISRNENRKGELVFKGFTQEELDILILNRSKMNQPGGYYILSHSQEAVDKGLYRKLPVESISRCLLATDGLLPLSYKYSKKGILDRIREIGAKKLITELRELEDSDRDKRSIGRLKTHDDATLIYMDFGLL